MENRVAGGRAGPLVLEEAEVGDRRRLAPALRDYRCSSSGHKRQKYSAAQTPCHGIGGAANARDINGLRPAGAACTVR
jgi:hypothetical protein